MKNNWIRVYNTTARPLNTINCAADVMSLTQLLDFWITQIYCIIQSAHFICMPNHDAFTIQILTKSAHFTNTDIILANQLSYGLVSNNTFFYCVLSLYEILINTRHMHTVSHWLIYQMYASCERTQSSQSCKTCLWWWMTAALSGWYNQTDRFHIQGVYTMHHLSCCIH